MTSDKSVPQPNRLETATEKVTRVAFQCDGFTSNHDRGYDGHANTVKHFSPPALRVTHVSIRSVEAALEIRKLWIADYTRILNTRVLRLIYTPGQKGDPTTASLKSLLDREGHRNGG
jgi:hypothetical protein